MSLPLIAVVGRPNVGKSTLFNKLIGQRLSIVEDTPGVTRDRIYAQGEWLNRAFMLVDTGGIEPKTDDLILSKMRTQAQIAIDSADVIIMVTDLRGGVTANDSEIAAMLRKSGKPVVLCVNKCDQLGAPPPELYEFYNLGLGDPIPVSSVHGHGTGELLDACFELIDWEAVSHEEADAIRVAVIGKPNVGKSSLVNYMAGEERVIVSGVAGTTRDSTDTRVENSHGRYILIDTAGIRRKARVEDAIERYSVLRSYMAVDRCDVAVILIDATQGFTEQDSKIAGYAHEQGKGCIVAVNKWDAVEDKTGRTMDEMKRRLEQDFSFMSYVPFLFISAKTGQRVDKLYDLINTVAEKNAMRIPTGRLNDLLSVATARVQPPSDKGKRLKIYYITQASTKPPTFVCFCNRAELFHFSYLRYLENQIREQFQLTGTPVRMVVRERGGSTN
jgi:GTP-binding protein